MMVDETVVEDTTSNKTLKSYLSHQQIRNFSSYLLTQQCYSQSFSVSSLVITAVRHIRRTFTDDANNSATSAMTRILRR